MLDVTYWEKNVDVSSTLNCHFMLTWPFILIQPLIGSLKELFSVNISCPFGAADHSSGQNRFHLEKVYCSKQKTVQAFLTTHFTIIADALLQWWARHIMTHGNPKDAVDTWQPQRCSWHIRHYRWHYGLLKHNDGHLKPRQIIYNWP